MPGECDRIVILQCARKIKQRNRKGYYLTLTGIGGNVGRRSCIQIKTLYSTGCAISNRRRYGTDRRGCSPVGAAGHAVRGKRPAIGIYYSAAAATARPVGRSSRC